MDAVEVFIGILEVHPLLLKGCEFSIKRSIFKALRKFSGLYFTNSTTIILPDATVACQQKRQLPNDEVKDN